tara:strand:- start:1442 stop:1777 length:336 start_codon:yes stop_codon:yes gene_type:complete
MNRSNYITLIIAILIILLVWYYTENKVVENKKSLLSDLFSFGTLDFSTSETKTITSGCTDPEAVNYNSDATTSNNSCFYVEGCCDIIATNYSPDADSCNVPNNDLLMCNYS